MRPLEIDQQTTLNHILGELKNGSEEGLELTSIPGEKSLLDNPINRSIIEKVAKSFNKKVAFPNLVVQEALPETDDLGFIEGEDIVSKMPMEEVPKTIKPASAGFEKPKVKKTGGFSVGKLVKSKLVWAVAALGVLLIVLLAAVLFLPTSTVTLTLSATSKDVTADVTADAKITASDATGKIPFTNEQVTKEGSDELTATTKKTIGTSATGRVTITNRDNVAKQFLKGTILTPISSSSVIFKLDSDTSLAAASFGGEVKIGASVTAAAAGDAGNLLAGNTFKVGSESSPLVFAQNDLAFTGGATQEVTVATQSDRDSLKTKLVNKLTKDATDQVQTKSSDSLVVEDSLATVVTKETYTPKAVDTQADKLKATIDIKTTATLIKKSDLLSVLVNKAKKDTSGFKIDETNSSVSATLVNKNPDGTLSLSGKLTAKLFPTFNKDKIAAHVAGKSLSAVGNYLNSLDNVSGYKVVSTPAPFRILRMLPFFKNQIKIVFVNQ